MVWRAAQRKIEEALKRVGKTGVWKSKSLSSTPPWINSLSQKSSQQVSILFPLPGFEQMIQGQSNLRVIKVWGYVGAGDSFNPQINDTLEYGNYILRATKITTVAPNPDTNLVYKIIFNVTVK